VKKQKYSKKKKFDPKKAKEISDKIKAYWKVQNAA